MKNLFTIFGILFLLVLSSCGTMRVNTDYDRDANFNQYKSFAFHQKGLDGLKMNNLDKRRIVTAVTNELSNKGMNFTTNENVADVIINISAKKRTRVDVEPNAWYSPWWGFGPYWGMNQNRVRQYKEGTLIIDMVDREKNILVWQGVGEGLNLSNLESKAERIPQALEEILLKFPPKK